MVRHIGILVGTASLTLATGLLPAYGQSLWSEPQQKQEQKQPPCTKDVTAAVNEIIPRANAYNARRELFVYTNYMSKSAQEHPECFVAELGKALGNNFSVSLSPQNPGVYSVKSK